MRIKVTLSKNNFTIPLSYQSILQGAIYSLAKDIEIKGFVFSSLFGKYTLVDNILHYENEFYFYISSLDTDFLKSIYHRLASMDFLMVGYEEAKIIDLKIFSLKPFEGEREVTLKALSPILIYSTENRYSTYYDLNSDYVDEYIQSNIRMKEDLYLYPIKDVVFHLTEVKYQKRRMVRFKNCIYPSYLGEFKVRTNFETLQCLYDSGMGSKNICGFGMIEVVGNKK